MGIAKKIFMFYALFFCLYLHAQESLLIQPKEYKYIAGKFSDFYTDKFGNIFLVNEANNIKKINSNGDSLSVFNDIRRYGNLYCMDVSNPLKIVLYYKDFATILVLDRFMNIVNTIDLRNSGIFLAKAVAQSYDNNYWIYDELDNKLKKINDNGGLLNESADFRLLFDFPFLPEKVIDVEGEVYLYDENFGWLIFDYYCAFKKKYPFPKLKNVEVINKQLIGFFNDSIYKSSLVNLVTTVSSFSVGTGALKTAMQINLIYSLKEDGLYIYYSDK